MGNFVGHAVPGTFFLMFGLWWAFAILRRYFLCKLDGTRFVSTPIYTWTTGPKKEFSSSKNISEAKGCRALLARLPMEAVVKMVFSFIGMCIEIGAHLPPPIPSRIVQHTTMYAFFLLSGLIDAMCFLGIPLPDGVQYVGMALALAVEGLLFASHVHGREILDINIHMLLVKVIAASIVVLLLEVRFRRHPLLPLSRAFLLMLQGSWFWAVAVILYKHGEGHSEWDLNSPESVMLATIYFSWHCGVIFIGMLVLNAAMACFYHRRRGNRSLQTFPKRTPMIPGTEPGVQSQNGTKYSILSTDDDDGNDDTKEERRDFEI